VTSSTREVLRKCSARNMTLPSSLMFSESFGLHCQICSISMWKDSESVFFEASSMQHWTFCCNLVQSKTAQFEL